MRRWRPALTWITVSAGVAAFGCTAVDGASGSLDSGPGQPEPDYLEVEHSDCLSEDYEWCDVDADTDGEPQSSVEWSYDAAVETLTVTHRNATFNCCPSGLRSWAEIEESAIDLREEDYLDEGDDWCDCECLFDLTSSIPGVPPGTYTLTIYEGDSEAPWETVGEITLE